MRQERIRKMRRRSPRPTEDVAVVAAPDLTATEQLLALIDSLLGAS